MLLSGRNTKGESCISPLFSVASITGCATIDMLRRASGACNGAAGDLFAGVVQWQNVSFPSSTRGFDSLHPLQAIQIQGVILRPTRIKTLIQNIFSEHVQDCWLLPRIVYSRLICFTKLEVIGCSDRISASAIDGRNRTGGQCHLLPRIPVAVLRQPLLSGGRSPRITRFGSNWR